jgi:hypothetical protein
MDLRTAENVIWYANVAATGVLIYTLIAQNLRSKYRFLFWFLVVDAGAAVLAMAVRGAVVNSPRAYLVIYFAGQAAKLILAVFIVLELFHLALAGHAALARWCRKAVSLLLAAVSVMAALSLLVAPPDTRRLAALQSFLAFERTMDLALVLLLLSIAAFLAWFPVVLPRNVAYYLAGFSAFFIARWAGAFALGTYPRFRTELSTAELAFSLLCLLAMAWSMRSQGERETLVAGRRWNEAEMDRLHRQLDALNARLTKSLG